MPMGDPLLLTPLQDQGLEGHRPGFRKVTEGDTGGGQVALLGTTGRS